MLDSLQQSFDKAFKAFKGHAKLKETDVETFLGEIRKTLIEADVNFQVVKRFLERVREQAVGGKITTSLTPFQELLKILSKEMLSIFGEGDEFNLSYKPPVIVLMAGLQGTGKTTSSAKLAAFAKKKWKRKPLLVSVDVTRPAAIEQLDRLAKDAKIDYINPSSQVPADRAREALKYAQTYGLDFVIVDTAGRLSIDEAMMKELEELKNLLQPQHVLYVADAMSGQQGLAVAEGFASRVGLTGAVLSKSDADARGGIAFSIREALSIPLQFVGTGERLDGLEPFFPKRWVSRILGQGDIESLFEKAEEAAAAAGTDTKNQAKKAMTGQMTLKDFQEQMKMISKMGSMKNIMGMIPGMGGMASKIDSEAIEKKLKRLDAMINSMTPQERENPDVLNGSRRRRITQGSGTTVEELNQFMKEFNEMQKLMKSFAGKGMRGLGSLLGGRPGFR